MRHRDLPDVIHYPDSVENIYDDAHNGHPPDDPLDRRVNWCDLNEPEGDTDKGDCNDEAE